MSSYHLSLLFPSPFTLELSLSLHCKLCHAFPWCHVRPSRHEIGAVSPVMIGPFWTSMQAQPCTAGADRRISSQVVFDGDSSLFSFPLPLLL